MTRKCEVTVLLPAYNEELAIGQVIQGTRRALDKSRWRGKYEILVVDDASTDRTAARAQKAGARVIRRRLNQGSGAARKTGILDAHGEVIVMLDADGSYESADIPKLLEYFPDYDQVNGARTSEEGTMKWLRFSAKWLIRQLAIFLTGVKIPDLNTGLKAFKRDLMREYLWVIPNGFSCVTTMTLAFLTNGHTVKYLPTKYHPRIGKSKFHPIRDTYRYAQTVIRMILYFNPLKIFMPLSLLLLLWGCGKAVLDRFFWIQHLQLSDVIIILTGLMIGMLGLLADLIVASRRGTAG